MAQLILGALLHDIGKIIYRAGRGSGNHSQRGAEFLKPFLPEGELRDAVLACVRYHHGAALKEKALPSSHPAWIVYEADNIAAGIDRRKDEGEGDENARGFEREGAFTKHF